MAKYHTLVLHLYSSIFTNPICPISHGPVHTYYNLQVKPRESKEIHIRNARYMLGQHYNVSHLFRTKNHRRFVVLD